MIRLSRHEKPPVEVKDSGLMFRIIRASFNQRRKTLANALVNSSSLVDKKGNALKVTRQEVYGVLDKMGISQTIRGEALTLEEFAELSNLL